jgi:hypothetical protein
VTEWAFTTQTRGPAAAMAAGLRKRYLRPEKMRTSRPVRELISATVP